MTAIDRTGPRVTISARVKELGYELPPASLPAANYASWTVCGSLLHIAGQISKHGEKPAFVGKVGRDWSLQQAREAATLAGLHLLAQISAAAGDDLSAVRKIARVGGYVNVTEDFDQISVVVDSASELLVAVFGEAGRHARTAVGVAMLPRGAAVELDAVVELHPGRMLLSN